MILVFCFSKNSSISFRNVLLLDFGLLIIGSDFSNIGSTFFGSGFSMTGSGFFGSGVGPGSGFSFDGDISLLISSSGVKVYLHIIFSCSLNGFAKSLRFLRATRIAGSSFSSDSSLFSLSFK